MKILTAMFLISATTLAFSAKGPDWWCRVVENDKYYIAYGLTAAEACAEAYKLCKQTCEIDDYGEW